MPSRPRTSGINLSSNLKALIGLVAVIALGIAAYFVFSPAGTAEKPNSLTLVTDRGRHDFTVELAVTDADQARGLMHRRSMAPNYGMLFVYQAERDAYFWMKNTYLSLDMIFIRKDGIVHHIARDTPPLSEDLISSNGSVLAVLEVLAGTSDRIGLKPGDRVEHEIFSPR